MYHSYQQLKTILAHVPFGVVIVDTDRRIRWANRRALILFDLSTFDDLPECGWHEVNYLGGQEQCPVLDQETQIHNSEQMLAKSDGTQMPVLKTVERMRLDGEDVLLETFVDITTTKESQSRPIEAHQDAAREALRLRSAIEGMEQGVALINASDIVTHINHWFLSKAELRSSQVVGRSIWDLHPQTEGTARLRSVLDDFRQGERREPYIVERRLMGMHLSLRVQPIFDDDRYQGCILNAIDVTDLVKARQAAEAAAHAKSLFSANMSHEIRTPMTAILGFTDTFLEYVDHPEARDAAHTIKRNGEYLLHIINDILDISKMEAGQIELDMVHQSPREIVAEVVSLLKVRADAKGLTLTKEYVGRVPKTIVTDPTRLRQTLINLVDNAIKFTETGIVRILTRSTQSRNADPQLRFDVVDTGIGMSEEQIETMFAPFTQGDELNGRQLQGTGLGLAVARRLSRLLGGDVTAQSSLGKGSTITLTVATPALDGGSFVKYGTRVSQTNKERADSRGQSEKKAGCRVLLAEDNEDIQRLISDILRQGGLEVTIAHNGQEAIEKALNTYPNVERAKPDQTSPFDVILMNVKMPIVDGHTATRQLRHNGYEGPIVALTAYAMQGDRQECIDAGCDDYLSKPIDRKKLLETVARWGPN